MRFGAARGGNEKGLDQACGRGGMRLLRQSSILSAAVRDVLALGPLREASEARLTVSQLHVLKLMTRDGHHQIGQVADLLGVSPPAATKTIDKLEALGLVVRTRSAGDRRATLLSASPRGRRVVRRYEALRRQRLAPALRGYDVEEIDALTRALERFSLALLAEEVVRGGDGACLRCDADIEPGCAVAGLRGGCPCPPVGADPNPRGEA
jgi:DNA-binding MarR family transcriptional regulator